MRTKSGTRFVDLASPGRALGELADEPNVSARRAVGRHDDQRADTTCYNKSKELYRRQRQLLSTANASMTCPYVNVMAYFNAQGSRNNVIHLSKCSRAGQTEHDLHKGALAIDGEHST